MKKRFVPNRWRKRYNYICIKCQSKRTTLSHQRMIDSQCTKCQVKVPGNQPQLL